MSFVVFSIVWFFICAFLLWPMCLVYLFSEIKELTTIVHNRNNRNKRNNNWFIQQLYCFKILICVSYFLLCSFIVYFYCDLLCLVVMYCILYCYLLWLCILSFFCLGYCGPEKRDVASSIRSFCFFNFSKVELKEDQ